MNDMYSVIRILIVYLLKWFSWCDWSWL